MHKLLLLFLLTFASVLLLGQGVYNPKEYNNGSRGIVYDKEFIGELQLQTNGFFVGANIGKLKSYYKTTFYHLSLGELKHFKEHKNRDDIRTSGLQESARSYVFGKQNNLFAFRAGMGVKRYLSEKARRKGLAVGISYELGPTLGLLKPYYLDVRRSEINNQNPVSQKFNGDNADVFLNTDRIFGASSVLKGLGEVKFRPGIHLRGGINFDWGAFDEMAKSMEIGVMADVFFGDVDIMIDDAEVLNPRPATILPENVKNQPFFINFYVSIQLGKRW